MTPTIIRIAATVAAVTAAAFLTACGGSSSDERAGHTSSTAGAQSEVAVHNADDVTFAQNMIPHHQQAVDMATLAPTNSANPDVGALANQISNAQLGEIQAFNTWLAQWGAPVKPDHSGHGAMGAAGMVDGPTLDKLRSLRGVEFDKLWLQSMISHHQGAITMAQQEIAHGLNRDAVSTARSIISTQQAEIDKMKQLLAGLK